MVFANDGSLMYFRSGRFDPLPVHHGQYAAEPANQLHYEPPFPLCLEF